MNTRIKAAINILKGRPTMYGTHWTLPPGTTIMHNGPLHMAHSTITGHTAK